MAIQNNWKLIGMEYECEACAFAKSKQKAVPKQTTTRAKKNGERIFIEISGPFNNSPRGNKYWVMVVDDFSRKKWSYYIPSKDKVDVSVEPLLIKLKGQGNEVQCMRCDCAGENKEQLVGLCKKYGIQPEITAANTPQMNGVVERAFSVVKEQAMAMLYNDQFTNQTRKYLWAEPTNTATYISNILPNLSNEGNKCSDKIFYGEKPKGFSYLRPFGKIGYVSNFNKIKGKMDLRGIKHIFVGYAKNSARDTYRMFNPRTRNIVESRDTQWADWHGGPNGKPTKYMLESKSDKAREEASSIIVPTGNEVLTEDFQQEEQNPTRTQDASSEESREASSGSGWNSDDLHLSSMSSSREENVVLSSSEEDELVLSSSEEEEANYTRLLMNEDKDAAEHITAVHTALVALISNSGEPKNFQEAMLSPTRDEWKQAVRYCKETIERATKESDPS